MRNQIRAFMKTAFKIFLIISGVVLCTNKVKSQDFNAEFKAHFNLAEFDMPGDNKDKVMKLGYGLGIGLNYKFQSGIFVHSGMSLTKKGSKKKATFETTSESNGEITYRLVQKRNTTIDANYAQVPLALGYEIFFNKRRKIGFNVSVGGFGAYGFKGKVKTSGNDSQYGANNIIISENIPIESTERDTFRSSGLLNSFDAGVLANANFIYHGYMLSVGYEYGLLDVSKTSQEMKTRNITVGVGMRF